MINAHVPGLFRAGGAATAVRRPGPRAFWLLFAVEGLVIGAALLALINTLLPARASMASAADADTVRSAIITRLDGTINDPLIEVAPGITARSSTVRGFSVKGVTYYYYFEGARGFDPLSRGRVDSSRVEVVLRDTGGDRPLVIYRLLDS